MLITNPLANEELPFAPVVLANPRMHPCTPLMS